ncbi:MAG: DUF1488 domain-containing protein [Rhizobium sp.]|nr:DUF1488 domain-containing protein [Rhizobium sp.]
MSIAFPNRSRSFDPTEKRVRFLGHDGMFEVRFFIGLDTLGKTASSAITSEGDALSAFDEKRRLILEAAEKAYARGKRNNMCVLTAADFH